MKTINIEWDLINEACYNIIEQIIESKIEFDTICGISRGGIIPAAIIARGLGLEVSSKNIQDIGYLDLTNTHLLIVDDIFETGTTINKAFLNRGFEKSPPFRCQFATLFNKDVERSNNLIIHKADYFYTSYPENSWLVFPWEEND